MSSRKEFSNYKPFQEKIDNFLYPAKGSNNFVDVNACVSNNAAYPSVQLVAFLKFKEHDGTDLIFDPSIFFDDAGPCNPYISRVKAEM